MLLKFQEKELNKLRQGFAELWKHSEPIAARWLSEYKLQIPDTEAAARIYLERLYNYKSSKPTNMTQYLRSASAHADSVAKYWKGLEGTIIRPSTATVNWVKQKLPSTVVQKAKVGILGSTPELRKLAGEHFKNSTVDVIDLSPVMIDAMSRVVDNPTSLKESAVVQNWLSLNLDTRRHKTYDFILGIDVLNMMNFSDMEILLRVIADLLAESGQFITQVIIKPTKEEYKNRYRLINEIGLPKAYELLKEQVKKGEISVEEMFASLCYGRLGTGDSVYIGGLLSEIEGWEESFDEEKPISRRYSLCNTTLFIPERLTVEKWMEKNFHISEAFREELGGGDRGEANVPSTYFRDYMFSYKLVKNS